MTRVLFWLVAILLFLVAIVFTINNHHDAMVSVWPLLAAPVAVPVHALVLVSVFVGFLFGALVAWLQGGATRLRLRQTGRRLHECNLQVKALNERLERLEQNADQAAIPAASRLPKAIAQP